MFHHSFYSVAMKKIIIICLLNCVPLTFLFGQSLTEYDKKCYAITAEFLKTLGVDNSTINKCKNLNDLGYIMTAALLQMKADGIDISNKVDAFERNVKAAEKFKTDVDFKRDKDNEEERKKLLKIDTERRLAKKKIEEEKAREIKKVEDFNNSDYFILSSQIASEFEKWYRKEEFEKTENYLTRLSSFSKQTFDSICLSKTLERLTKINLQKQIKLTLEKYDADVEMFQISINLNKLKWFDTLRIPLKDAEKFKNNFVYYQLLINNKDLYFIENNLFPKQLTFQLDNFEKLIKLPAAKIENKEISFNAGDMKLKDAPSKELLFDYKNYLTKFPVVEVEKIKEKVIKGNRNIIVHHSDNIHLDKATIIAAINVSQQGVGTFIRIGHGSTSFSRDYAKAVINYLQSIKFNITNEESLVEVQFEFD